jgi:hypothetical protein
MANHNWQNPEPQEAAVAEAKKTDKKGRIEDLPAKPVSSEQAKDVKGGRRKGAKGRGSRFGR